MKNHRKYKSCLEDLRKLYGLPPYDDWTNLCALDGYFAASIERAYSPKVYAEATKQVEKEQKKWNKIRRKFEKELK